MSDYDHVEDADVTALFGDGARIFVIRREHDGRYVAYIVSSPKGNFSNATMVEQETRELAIVFVLNIVRAVHLRLLRAHDAAWASARHAAESRNIAALSCALAAIDKREPLLESLIAVGRR